MNYSEHRGRGAKQAKEMKIHIFTTTTNEHLDHSLFNIMHTNRFKNGISFIIFGRNIFWVSIFEKKQQQQQNSNLKDKKKSRLVQWNPFDYHVTKQFFCCCNMYTYVYVVLFPIFSLFFFCLWNNSQIYFIKRIADCVGQITVNDS